MVLENLKTIEVPPSVAWAVTRDVQNWPHWTPTVTKITRLDDGPFDVGSIARIQQPGLPECEWRVTELTDGVGFTWETRVRGMYLSATHELVAHLSGTTSILRLKTNGIVSTLLWPIIRVSAKNNLELENAGLKAQCEAA